VFYSEENADNVDFESTHELVRGYSVQAKTARNARICEEYI
jgi:hypothetical protein